MMNTMYQEAGKANCATFCEGAMACMTAYLIHFCSETVRMNTMNLLALITHVKCLNHYGIKDSSVYWVNLFEYFQHYEKCLKKVARFVVEQNEQVWTKRGLLITDPIERGLRVIEISILTEPAQQLPSTTNWGQPLERRTALLQNKEPKSLFGMINMP